MKFQPHPFHLVDSSPWPLATSLALLITTIGGAAKIHGYSGITLTIGIITLLTCMFLWWKDVITESITLKCFPVIKITV
jgi:Cytochrome c oxidase subunit III